MKIWPQGDLTKEIYRNLQIYEILKPIPARKHKLVGKEIVKGASGNMDIIKVYEMGIQTSTIIRIIRKPGNKQTKLKGNVRGN